MEEQTSIDKIITDFIYEQPEVVVELLALSGYKISGAITLQKITAKAFTAIYQDQNKKFIELLGGAIENPDYNNIVMAIAALAVSVIGMLSASKQAKNQLELQKNIALAQMAIDKKLGEEQIRAQSETERTKILLTTLQQYRSDLQVQSTKRIQDVWIYTGILACSVSVLYGTFVLLKNS